LKGGAYYIRLIFSVFILVGEGKNSWIYQDDIHCLQNVNSWQNGRQKKGTSWSRAKHLASAGHESWMLGEIYWHKTCLRTTSIRAAAWDGKLKQDSHEINITSEISRLFFFYFFFKYASHLTSLAW